MKIIQPVPRGAVNPKPPLFVVGAVIVAPAPAPVNEKPKDPPVGTTILMILKNDLWKIVCDNLPICNRRPYKPLPMRNWSLSSCIIV